MCRKLIYLVCGVVVLVMAGGVPAGAVQVPITVENYSFELPAHPLGAKPQFGVGQPGLTGADPCQLKLGLIVPGWARDNSGDQAGIEDPNKSRGTEGICTGYEGINESFNRTMFIASAGDRIRLQYDARNWFNGRHMLGYLYYDEGKYGTRHYFATIDVNLQSLAQDGQNSPFVTYDVNAFVPYAAREHKIGVAIKHEPWPGHGGNNWMMFDWIRLTLLNPLYRAQNVAPKDESICKTANVTLKWAPGPNTPTTPVPAYIVYWDYGDSNWADVNSGATDANKGTQGPNSLTISGLVGGENYYWRIDTRSGATTYRGNIWTFQTQPLYSWGPNPTNDYRYVPINPTLSWNAGSGVGWGHRVFFDTSYTAVRDANTDPCNTALPYRAKLNKADTNWAPSEYAGLAPLDVNTYYYWRVDEVNKVSPTKVVYKGSVWKFKTVVRDGLGTILLEEYDNIPGGLVSDLTSNPAYPYSPTITYEVSSFEAPGNPADAYGTRMHGWLYIETTGDYTFWIAADDTGQLWLSTDDEPSNIGDANIADVVVSTGARQWNADPNHQRSKPKHLVRGNRYYIMALEKENFGPSNLSVAWARDSNNVNNAVLIPGTNLMPFRPTVSYNPNPLHRVTEVGREPNLSWTPGPIAKKHDLYFGTDETKVADANRASHPGLLWFALDLASTRPTTTYNPAGQLDLEKTYYWRVDDVNAAEDPNIRKGAVWYFTTANYLVVDNFEEYSPSGDYPLPEAWVTYHAVAGELVCPTCNVHDQNFVHDGNHSMKCEYTGSGEVDAITGGDLAEGELPIGPDWTEQGLKALTLYFYGEPSNTVLPMYVQLNNGGNKKYYSDPNDLKKAGWHEWDIPLADFGVNLANVTMIAIGFEGTGSGAVYFDGIRLYRPRCVPGLAKPAGDFDNDCDVDYNDLDIMTSQWLVGDYTANPLIAWYKLDGNAVDSSGHGNNGTAYGNVNWGTAGQIGTAIDLNGVHDYIDCSNSVSLDITQAVTLTAWVKTRDCNNSEYHPYVAKGDNYGLQHKSNNTIEFFIHDAYTNTWPAVALTMPDANLNGTWRHLAGTYDGNELKLYVDGADVNTTAHIGSIGATTYNLNIGRSSQYVDRLYNGLIDDVRVYDKALSQAEIVSIMAGGLGTVGTYHPLTTPVDLYRVGAVVINFKDFAVLANNWLEEKLWP